MKTTKVTAATATVLAWGLLKFRAGYETADQLEPGMQTLKWGLDYILKCFNETENLLSVKVGIKVKKTLNKSHSTSIRRNWRNIK